MRGLGVFPMEHKLLVDLPRQCFGARPPVKTARRGGTVTLNLSGRVAMQSLDPWARRATGAAAGCRRCATNLPFADAHIPRQRPGKWLCDAKFNGRKARRKGHLVLSSPVCWKRERPLAGNEERRWRETRKPLAGAELTIVRRAAYSLPNCLLCRGTALPTGRILTLNLVYR